MSEVVAASTEVEKAPVHPAIPVEVPVEVKVEEKKEEKRVYDQEEVDKILAKVRKNERYRTRKEVEAFYAGRDSAAPKTEAQPKQDADKDPVRADFESYEEYIEARTEHRARKVAREETAKVTTESKQRDVVETKQKQVQTFQAKVREKYADIEERTEQVGDMPMHIGVQEAIMDSPLGPEIFNELLNQPKEFERLAEMSVASAIKEIGKLEARLEAKSPKVETKTEVPKQASKAPAPITPPGGATAAVSAGPSDSDDINTWMTKERARTAKRQ